LTAFIIPTLLFALFALFSAGGAYFLTAQTHGRNAGIVAALLTFLFFVLLFMGLLFLLPPESLSGTPLG
jgi:amino acid transporter